MAKRDREKKKGKATRRESIRDKARQAAEQREKGGGGSGFVLKDIPREMERFKPKMGKGSKGTNRFSVVPYIVSIKKHPFQEIGEPWYECTYWRHNVGVDQDTKKFICLSKTAQSPHKRCPICEYREKLIREGRTKEADELKPKQRQIFNILDHDNEDKGVQLFDISPWDFGFMLDDEDKAQSHKFEERFYGDYQNGLLIEARFDARSFKGKESPEIARIDFEERDDLEEDILEQAVDFDAALNILSPEELEAKFFDLEDEDSEPEEEEEEEGEEEEEEERPSRSSKKDKGRKTRKPEPEPEEEEEEEEEDPEPEEGEEEEEEEEEPSKGKEKGRTSRSQKKTEAGTPSSKKSSKISAGKCPHGGEFGGDCDTLDECPDCAKWDDCRDKLDEIEAEKRQKKGGGRKKR